MYGVYSEAEKMKCPKCGGVMIYIKRTDMLECLSCFYKRLPNDRIKKIRKVFPYESKVI